MRATRRMLAAVLAAGAAAAGLAGCGGDRAGADAPLVRPMSSRVSDEGPFAGLTGHQVLIKANAAMRAASAFTFHEDGTSGGRTVHITSVMTGSGRCTATMRDDSGVEVQVLGTGSAYYLKGTRSFWEGAGVPGGALRLLNGSWLRVPADAAADAGTIGLLCDKDRFMDHMTSEVDVGTIAKHRPTTVGGAPALPLVHVKPTATSTLYVAMTGRPYLLECVVPTTGGGRATEKFSGFGHIPPISAPPADRTVEPAQLGASQHLSV
ncbi:hypothetical protein [Actinacidiphila acidipaludis]|uniref:Lipoprotein n=1 Tax=Actinacidiphila acidipaludis TaxID=2873382 RepID=A0ABS7Q1Y1_9ACTN|nr:hypothetical protein [Streptomyces acidipaludis]MBY8876963.1 hypothetical protein [Streptomyces acidipaludis]